MNSLTRTHPFSLEDFHRMAHVGILTEDDRVELIEGELIPMTPIGPRHAACVDTLNKLFVQQAPEQVVVRIPTPLSSILRQRSTRILLSFVLEMTHIEPETLNPRMCWWWWKLQTRREKRIGTKNSLDTPKQGFLKCG